MIQYYGTKRVADDSLAFGLLYRKEGSDGKFQIICPETLQWTDIVDQDDVSEMLPYRLVKLDVYQIYKFSYPEDNRTWLKIFLGQSKLGKEIL